MIRFEQILEELQDKNSYKVSRTEDKNAVKYFFERVQKEGSISESYNVVIPEENNV
ncbi:hypothetical protein [Lentibacillus sp. CBA3610]|uniref:hypothetical protein n=1 Tax=Lentibacillus sp. CBA3610 TaxID=2518176 RepID=UPI001595B4F5|nr:hypothetical protein [Lentibacillus sp. CBA3610]